MSENNCPYYKTRCLACEKKNPLIPYGFCNVYSTFKKEDERKPESNLEKRSDKLGKPLALIFGFIFMLVIASSMASALGPFIQNSESNIKIPCEINGNSCSNLASCNISIKYQNGNYLVSPTNMTNLGNGDFNIQLNKSQTAEKGKYKWDMYCCDGVFCGSGHGNFQISLNGKEDPSGAVIIFFVAGFIVIIALLLFFMLYPIFYFIELGQDWEKENKPVFDLKDFIYNLSGYLLLIIFYMFSHEYLANAMINKIMSITIWVTTFTNFISSIVAFVLSFNVVGWSGIIKAMKGEVANENGQG